MTSRNPAIFTLASVGEDAQVVLTINGGSSSIKFGLFASGIRARRLAGGEIDRIGRPDATLTIAGEDKPQCKTVDASDHRHAAKHVMDWVKQWFGAKMPQAIGHRIVHGGLQVRDHQRVTPELLAELRRNIAVDLSHLPGEIAIMEACGAQFPGVPQVACFDSAFHHTMPPVAQRLPIPRKYSEQGLRRLGFHGLSYTYLMNELARLDPQAASGRVIMAHLGSGASMAAVRGGTPIDTTMAFTPLAGLVMGTRPGDLDPGLLAYLIRKEQFSPDELDDLLNRQCGMLGVSQSSSDMRNLLAASANDARAADAVDLFCYRARQWIGALAASMEGLDTLIFAGGIGERSPQVRKRICNGLRFLDIQIDESQNDANAPVISTVGRRVNVRIIPTDEEIVIAEIVARLVNIPE